MKVDNILDAIGAINDETVQDARAYKRTKYSRVAKWGAMVACLFLIVVATIPIVNHLNDTATDIEPFIEYSLEEATTIAEFGELFPTQILEGYVLEGSVGVYDETVLQAKFYNDKLEDELVIEIAHKGWYFERHNDLVLNTVLYRETINARGSYIYIDGGEYIVQYSFNNTDIATSESFYDMVNSAAYFK